MAEVLETEFILHSLFPCATRREVGREFRSEVEPERKGGEWRKWVPDSAPGCNLCSDGTGRRRRSKLEISLSLENS